MRRWAGRRGSIIPTGKNLLGAFHQPSGVVADLAHLATLPARERTAGLAEVVKIALATDGALFAELERDAVRVSPQGTRRRSRPIVRRAIEAKVRIVRDDERETGRRALLNLGHTVGHALESHGQYRKHLHGEAVALGMLAELGATAKLGFTPASLVERARALFGRLGLPHQARHAEIGAAWPFVSADKKRVMTRLRLPVVVGAGEARIEHVELEALREAVLASVS